MERDLVPNEFVSDGAFSYEQPPNSRHTMTSLRVGSNFELGNNKETLYMYPQRNYVDPGDALNANYAKTQKNLAGDRNLAQHILPERMSRVLPNERFTDSQASEDATTSLQNFRERTSYSHASAQEPNSNRIPESFLHRGVESQFLRRRDDPSESRPRNDSFDSDVAENLGMKYSHTTWQGRKNTEHNFARDLYAGQSNTNPFVPRRPMASDTVRTSLGNNRSVGYSVRPELAMRQQYENLETARNIVGNKRSFSGSQGFEGLSRLNFNTDPSVREERSEIPDAIQEQSPNNSKVGMHSRAPACSRTCTVPKSGSTNDVFRMSSNKSYPQYLNQPNNDMAFQSFANNSVPSSVASISSADINKQGMYYQRPRLYEQEMNTRPLTSTNKSRIARDATNLKQPPPSSPQLPGTCENGFEQYRSPIRSLSRLIGGFKIGMDLIKSLDAMKNRKVMFLFQIGQVIEKALYEAMEVDQRGYELPLDYLGTLEEFVTTFLSHAYKGTREGLLGYVSQQLPLHSCVENSTGTATSNGSGLGSFISFGQGRPFPEGPFLGHPAYGGVTTESVEGSQTNESGFTHRISKGLVQPDTEPSQQSQYSARSHHSSTIPEAVMDLATSQTQKKSSSKNSIKKRKTLGRELNKIESEELHECINDAAAQPNPDSHNSSVSFRNDLSRHTESRSFDVSDGKPVSSEAATIANNSRNVFELQRNKSPIQEELVRELKHFIESVEKYAWRAKEFQDRDYSVQEYLSLMGKLFKTSENSFQVRKDFTCLDSTAKFAVIQAELEYCQKIYRRLNISISKTEMYIRVQCEAADVPFCLPYLILFLSSEYPEEMPAYCLDRCGVDWGEIGVKLKDEFNGNLRRNTFLSYTVIGLISAFWDAFENTSKLFYDFSLSTTSEETVSALENHQSCTT